MLNNSLLLHNIAADKAVFICCPPDAQPVSELLGPSFQVYLSEETPAFVVLHSFMNLT